MITFLIDYSGYIRTFCSNLKIINDQLLVLCYVHNISDYRTTFVFLSKELTIQKYFVSSLHSAGSVSGYGTGHLGVAVQEGTYEQLGIGFSDSSQYTVCI